MTTKHLVLGGLAVMCALLGPTTTDCQTLSPFSEFQAMPMDSLRTLQVKLTYGGAQKGSRIPTALFTSTTSTPSVTPFVPFYRTGFSYANDESIEPSVSLQVGDLQALINGVATLPEVTDGGVDSAGKLSFALQNYFGGTSKVFESILDATNGRALFGKILAAVAANEDARTALSGYACTLGMMPGSPPQDVTSSVTAALKGVRLDRKTNRFVGRLRVKNTSGHTLSAPMIATLLLKGGATLAASDGVTSCLVPPWGTPYVSLPVGSGLGAGQDVEVKVSFTNPDAVSIEVQSVHVLSGAGTP